MALTGTGLRFHDPAIPASISFNGILAPVEYFGPHGQFLGLDQVIVRLPKSLAGAGEVGHSIYIEGKYSNGMTVNIR